MSYKVQIIKAEYVDRNLKEKNAVKIHLFHKRNDIGNFHLSD